MARTDEAQAFFYAVYSAIQEIPHGRVTTYGHIAKLIGTPQRPRQVGVCLKHLSHDTSARYNSENVPWQRVINSKGGISPSQHEDHAEVLRAEGVTVSTGALGELSVDLAEYGWFPNALPSGDGEPISEGEED